MFQKQICVSVMIWKQMWMLKALSSCFILKKQDLSIDFWAEKNQSALDCQSHFFRRGLLDPSCNMLQHHANIHVFMMLQEYAIHVQHSIHHSKANPVPASLLFLGSILHRLGLLFQSPSFFAAQLKHSYFMATLTFHSRHPSLWWNDLKKQHVHAAYEST